MRCSNERSEVNVKELKSVRLERVDVRRLHVHASEPRGCTCTCTCMGDDRRFAISDKIFNDLGEKTTSDLMI